MHDNFVKLETLTEQLPPLPSLASLLRVRENGVAEYDIQGECKCVHLWSTERGSAVWAWMAEGSVFPAHKHETREWLIVLSGTIEAKIGNVVTRASTGAHVWFEVGAEHIVTAITDAEMIGVTVPKEDGYP